MQHKEDLFKSVCISHYNPFVNAGFVIRVKINANNCLCSAEILVIRGLQNTPRGVRTILLLLKSYRWFVFSIFRYLFLSYTLSLSIAV